MKIYIFSQTCVRSGRIAAIDPADATEYDGDCHLWEGTEEELISQARERLSKRLDTRPGGADDAYPHKCCRSILAALGADEDAA